MMHRTNTFAIPLILRNDDYGYKLNDRINHFIQYYSSLPSSYHEHLVFYVVDWNPPPNKKPLRIQFNWDCLPFKTKHFVFNHSSHLAISPDNPRPIYDYLGRNIIASICDESHILIINQDILLPKLLLDKCLKLPPAHFLTADRLDLAWDSIDNPMDYNLLRELEFSDSSIIHRNERLINEDENYLYDHTFTPPIHHGEFNNSGDYIFTTSPSRLISISKYFPTYFNNSSLYSSLCNRVNNFFGKSILPPSGFFHKLFPAHTNTSGDFLALSRSDFLSVGGYPFSSDWYMHVDGHMLYKLLSNGLSQVYATHAPFFHLDHSRFHRSGRIEALDYSQHMYLWDSYFKTKSSTWALKQSWDRFVPYLLNVT